MTVKSEHAEQVELFRWANEVAYAGFELVLSKASKPYDKAQIVPVSSLSLMHAIPNGGARGNDSTTNKIRGGMLKAEGVKKGVPDIFLPVPKHNLCGLYIELKVADRTKGRPSKEQLEFIDQVTKLGYGCRICYGAEEAKQAICEWYGWNYEV